MPPAPPPFRSSLVIVESATKAKVIEKYLNADIELRKLYGKFTVVASQGHINDLGPRKLSINASTYEPEYVILANKKKRVADLKRHVKSHDMVFLASDADREGAGIAYQLKTVLRPALSKRMVFTEITPTALKNAMLKATDDIDMSLVDAQKARRVLDRLVGYKISPLLWRAISSPSSTVSAGRVQSAVLKLVCDRETHIKDFKAEFSWGVKATLEGFDIDATMTHPYKESTKIIPIAIKVNTLEDAREAIRHCGNHYKLQHMSTKNITRSAPPPFVTSTMQQDAQTRHGFGLKRTMALAQGLYEKGLITYMRTDSHSVSKDAVESILSLVSSEFGASYIAGQNASTSKRSRKQKNAQEAHECIRPTDVSVRTIPPSANLEVAHQNLYDTIWKRTVASFMAGSIYEERTVVLVPIANTQRTHHAFVSRERHISFDGYMRAHATPATPQHKLKQAHNAMGEEFACVQCVALNYATTPQSRFTEASMVKQMEQDGIGRPSTYASILSKLSERGYVDHAPTREKDKDIVMTHLVYKPSTGSIRSSHKHISEIHQDESSEEESVEASARSVKGLRPTNLGVGVNDLMTKYFSPISDSKFTARMEADLDKIASGSAQFFDTIKAFDDELERCILEYKLNPPNTSKVATQSLSIEVDGTTYVLRKTRFGPVIQYSSNRQNGKSNTVYVDLRSYMAATRTTSIEQIPANDITFLASLPMVLPNVAEETILHYGRYGFYVERNGKRRAILVSTSSGESLNEKLTSMSQKDIDAMAALVQPRRYPKKLN
jgi:DNA topoisomerase I